MKKCIDRYPPVLRLLVVALLLVVVPRAHAFTAVLTLSDGTYTTNILDQSAADSSSIPGTVQFASNIDGWSVNATGVNVGTPSDPQLTLNTTQTSSGPGTLTVDFSDVNFTALSPLEVQNYFFGTVGENPADISATTWESDSDVVTQKTTLLTSTGPILVPYYPSGIGFFLPTNGSASVSAPFSLTIETVATETTGAGYTSFQDQLTTVPEPSSWALCALALIAFLPACRSRQRL